MECKHRTNIHTVGDKEYATCNLVLGALKHPDLSIVGKDACTFCLKPETPTPSKKQPNQVTGSFIIRGCNQLIARGIDVVKLNSLKLWAMKYIRKERREAKRPEPCFYLGKVIENTSKTCPRCWIRHCDVLGKSVQQNSECETCNLYLKDD